MPRRRQTPPQPRSDRPYPGYVGARAAARSAHRRAQQSQQRAWGSPRVKQRVRQSAKRRQREALEREAKEQGVNKLIKQADEGLKWMQIVNRRMGQQEYTNKLKQGLDLWQLAIESFSSGNYEICSGYLDQVISLAREVDGMYNEYLNTLRRDRRRSPSPGPSPDPSPAPSPFSPFLGPLMTPGPPPIVLTPGNTQPRDSPARPAPAAPPAPSAPFQSPGGNRTNTDRYDDDDEDVPKNLTKTFGEIPTIFSPSDERSPKGRRLSVSTNLASTLGQPAVW